MFGQRDALISIAVVTYNGERYLREQLGSLIAQSYTNFEIVVADDGSSDGTVDIAREFLGDDRVQLVEYHENVGLRENLNRVLPLLRGDYIAICDQDDVWRADKLARLIESVGDAAGIYSDSQLIDATGALLGKTLLESLSISNPEVGNNYVGLAYKNCVSGHAALFRRDVVQRALPLLQCPIYDQQLAMVAAAFGGIRYFDKPLVFHRQHDSNTHNRRSSKRPTVFRATRSQRVMQVGRNLQFVTDKILSSGESSFMENLVARFVRSIAVLLQSERGGIGDFCLLGKLLFISRSLFRYSRQSNVILAARKLCG